MGHQDKYKTAVPYNPHAPASSYSNPSVHTRLTQYIETAKEVYGPDYDPAAHDIDGEVVMRAGGGKVRGRYMIGDGSLVRQHTTGFAVSLVTQRTAKPPILPCVWSGSTRQSIFSWFLKISTLP